MLSARRYYLRKWRELEERCQSELARLFRNKQLELPGTLLSAGFPAQTELARAGYLAVEDLVGAELDELVDLGLDEDTAARVIAAANNAGGMSP